MIKKLCTLICLLPAFAAANSPRCGEVFLSDYIKQSEGQSIAIDRIESLGGKNVLVRDVSDYVIDLPAKSAPDTKTVRIPDVFENAVPFIGFGRPNVYIALNDANGQQVRFAAKSLFREPSKLEKVNKGVVQSGVWITFPNASPEFLNRLERAAKKNEGSRKITCAHAVCHVLYDAGLTIGDKDPREYRWPKELLRAIIHQGIKEQGQQVQIEIVRTTHSYLENLGFEIDKATWKTPCRHAQRACEGEKQGLAAYVVKIANSLPRLFITRESTETPKIFEPAVVRLPHEKNNQELQVQVSAPSKLGTLLRLLYGPHTLFELQYPKSQFDIDQFLPTKLHAYADPKLSPAEVAKQMSWSTWIKKNILFKRAVVGFIRTHLSASYSSHQMSQKQLFDMLRSSGDGLSNKYNIVITGEKIIVTKIEVGDPTADWILTKHVLLAHGTQDVRFAGEIWKTTDRKIMINRNSGTFKPTTEMLNMAQDFLTKQFPGIEIEVAN